MSAPGPPEAGTAGPPTSRRRAALVNVFFHYVAVAFLLIQGIVLVPLYMRHVPVALYGAWLATGNVLSWLELVDPGLSSLLQQRVAFTHGAGRSNELPAVIGTGVALSAALGALPLLCWPAAVLLPEVLHLTGQEGTELVASFRIGLMSTGLVLVSYGVTAVNLGLQRSLAAGLTYSAAAVIGIGATIALLLSGLGLRALPLGLLARSAVLVIGNVLALASWFRATKAGRPRLERTEFASVARLSGFSFLARLGTALVGRLDALLCATMLSPSIAAVLTLTGRAFDPVRMAAERIPAALAPGLAHLAGSGQRRRLVEVTRAVWTGVGLVLAAGVAAVVALDAIFVTLWVGPSLFGGHRIAFAIAVATSASVLANGMNQMVFALGGVRQASLASVAEGGLRLALQVGLVPFVGVIGMPLGALAATLATSAWYLPVAAAAMLGEPRWAALGRWWLALARAMLLAGVGLGLALALDRWGTNWTWTRFALAAAAVGLMLGVWVAWRGLSAWRAVRGGSGASG